LNVLEKLVKRALVKIRSVQMIRHIDINNKEIAQSLLNVQIPSYQVEAELINFSDLPPLRETIENLQHCGEKFYGYYINDELAGAISYKVEENTLDIHRLMVAPIHFRKGIGNLLLQFIETVENDVHEIIVSTGANNTPAKNLYFRQGYSAIGEIKVTEGLLLSKFKKKMIEL
jgi:ribosomal protein S18 acetylase RimI-like enzyme